MRRLTHRLTDELALVLHHDDDWLDEVRLCHEDGPLLRLVTRYRYKTSGLSGDEWRTSTVWQASDLISVAGDQHVDEREPEWRSFDGPYSGKIEVGCAALYPGLYSSQRHIHDLPVVRVEFLRKRRVLWSATYDGESRPLLTAAGHLPWALVLCRDEATGTDEAWEDCRTLCLQPGCAEPAVSTYRVRQLFDHAGNASPATTERFGVERSLVYRFCPLHLRRGDCGLEDADENLEVLEGPGPEEAVGWEAYQSRARFAGTVEIGGGGE